MQVVQTVLTENGHSASAAFHDRDWQRLRWTLSSPLRPENFLRPARFDRLIELAERIASGFDHLRVDFYDFDDDFRVGEITLYSWSGFIPFNPKEADSIMGAHWEIRSPMWRALKTICMQRREIRANTLPPQSALDGKGKQAMAEFKSD